MKTGSFVGRANVPRSGRDVVPRKSQVVLSSQQRLHTSSAINVCRLLKRHYIFVCKCIFIWRDFSVQEAHADRLRLLPLVSSALGVAAVVVNRLVDVVRRVVAIDVSVAPHSWFIVSSCRRIRH